MATLESMMIRCNAALVRIENGLRAMQGLAPLERHEQGRVRRVYRDREMLRVIQLETLAAWVEEIASQPEEKQFSDETQGLNPPPENPIADSSVNVQDPEAAPPVEEGAGDEPADESEKTDFREYVKAQFEPKAKKGR